MVSTLWILLIIIGVLFSLFTGNIDKINTEILSCGSKALEISLKILPVLALWLGIMKIASKSGLLKKISKLIKPILRLIFNEIDYNHESLDYISSNVLTNIFGLGSASTPFGLKAMKSLQELNPNKEVASKSMITFIILNTSGLTILPTTVISLRMMHNSSNPSNILFACILSTLISTIISILIDKIFRRIK